MQPNNNHRMRLLASLIALIVLASTLLISALIGQYAPTSILTGSEFAAESSDRNLLEANTEFKIPASATDIHGYVTGFRDLTTLLRFTLPMQDFELFIRQTTCTLPLASDDTRSRWMQNSPEHEWWRPGDAQRFGICSDSTQQLARRLLADMTRPDRYIIYVVASTR